MEDGGKLESASTSRWTSLRWSLRHLNHRRVQQLLVLFCASAILLTMAFIILSMIAADNYPLGVMAVVDAATFLGLGAAILFATQKRTLTLSILLVCISIPANLIAEIMGVPLEIETEDERLRPDARVPGEIVDLSGRVLGRHDGVIGFTIGQRLFAGREVA